MASVPTVTFTGTNVNTFGVYLNADVEGWLGAPGQDYATASFVGGIGGVVSRYPTTGPRRLQLPIRLYADAVATRETYEQTLKAYLTKDVTVKLDDGTTAREITGRCVGVTLMPYRVPVSVVSDGVVAFVCADPLWRSTSSTNETINGTPNTLDLGNAPVSDWVLTITATTNSITDITITLGPNTLTWTGTIAAGQALVIDASDFTVENNAVDALATYSGGFPAINPNDAPAVSATKGSGSGTLGGTLVYKKRYW